MLVADPLLEAQHAILMDPLAGAAHQLDIVGRILLTAELDAKVAV